MEFATLLLNLLAAGAGLTLAPEGAAAFQALTARLEDDHDVETLSMLPRAPMEAGVRQSLLSELLDPAIAADPGVTVQAEMLRAAIEALPEEETIRFGLGEEALRTGRAVIAALVEEAPRAG